MPDYDKLRDIDVEVAESLRMYIEEGYSSGGFLEAVLSNDLFDVVAHADAVRSLEIPDIVRWIFNEAPQECWGSRDKVRDWKHTFWCTDPEHVKSHKQRGHSKETV